MSVISGAYLLDLIIQEEGGIQQNLPMYTPRFRIPIEYVTSVVDMINCELTETGSNYSSTGTVDHPSFARLRNYLESKELISTSRNSWNGDVVLKKFYLNDVLFERGDRFYCGSAMRWYLERKNGN